MFEGLGNQAGGAPKQCERTLILNVGVLGEGASGDLPFFAQCGDEGKAVSRAASSQVVDDYDHGFDGSGVEMITLKEGNELSGLFGG